MGTTGFRRTLACAFATTLATWALVAPAVADPKGEPGNSGQSGVAKGHEKQAGKQAGKQDKEAKKPQKAKKDDKAQGKQRGRSGSAPQGKAKGHDKQGQHGAGQGAGANGSGSGAKGGGKATGQDPTFAGDPPGNNGTVKIAPLGEMDGIPNNTPHPGCVFQVEWYGFDGGSDVVSTVSFAMQAPTSDVALTVDGPTQVPVGGDAASGAGTDTGLDAVATYTLGFTGEPHPKQGYHVKLTVSTPRSIGNDTKTKVFWVEPCETAVAAPSETETESDATGTAGTADASESPAPSPSVLGAFAEADEPAADDPAARAAGEAAGEAAVPTVVDAGDDSLLPEWTRNPFALAAIAAGGALIALGLVLHRRRA